jgi:exodeoxyribonuclease VII large subunit
MDSLTLLELNRLVRENLKRDFPTTYWVKAEISECKEHYSGHCYLELIEKKKGEDTICARARATIWASVWKWLSPQFEQQTGAPLQVGQQILAEVAVEFHELYGFSLIIKDIDSSYTLGDRALRRQEILRQLESDGVLRQNKELPMPMVPRRIAVVSSPMAAVIKFYASADVNSWFLSFIPLCSPARCRQRRSFSFYISGTRPNCFIEVTFDVVGYYAGGGSGSRFELF